MRHAGAAVTGLQVQAALCAVAIEGHAAGFEEVQRTGRGADHTHDGVRVGRMGGRLERVAHVQFDGVVRPYGRRNAALGQRAR